MPRTTSIPEKVGLEAYRVIAEAMAGEKKAAIGRIVLSTREHPALVEPRGGGFMMFLLRTADEVRAAEYDFPEVKIDRKMVEIAGTIMERQAGHFEPAQFIDRYQDAVARWLDVTGIRQTDRLSRSALGVPAASILYGASYSRALHRHT